MKIIREKIGSILIIWILMLCNSLPGNGAEPAAYDRQLSEILTEISEKYQVIITYDAAMLAGVRVDIKPGELPDNFEAALSMIMEQTNLDYMSLGTKYYVIYKETREGKRDVRKLKRKVKQIQKIESAGKISLGRRYQTTESNALNMLSSVKYLLQGIEVSGTVTDNEGNPLIGVNIQIKGTQLGTATDFDGR